MRHRVGRGEAPRVFPRDGALDLGGTVVRFRQNQFYAAFQRIREIARAATVLVAFPGVLVVVRIVCFRNLVVLKGKDLAVDKEVVAAPFRATLCGVGWRRVGFRGVRRRRRVGFRGVRRCRRVGFCGVGFRCGRRRRSGFRWNGLGFGRFLLASAKRTENEGTEDEGFAQIHGKLL